MSSYFYSSVKGKTVVLCQQKIMSISLYDLEGSVNQAIQWMKDNLSYENKQLAVWDEYIDNDKRVLEYRESRLVTFDEVRIVVDKNEYGENELILYGFRKATESEIVAYEKQHMTDAQEQKKRRQAEYEKLKLEFEGK